MPPVPYQPIPDKTQVRVDPIIGQRIAGYSVEEHIGEGGTGIVYRASQYAGEQYAAVKIFRPEIVGDEATAKRIFEEARAVSSIGCRGVVEVFANGKLPDGRHWWAIEHLDGEPLNWVLRRGPVTTSQAIEILDQVVAALAAAHAWAIVHGHLKPSNVFLVKTADSSTLVKLLDFGLAKMGHVLGRLGPDGQVQVIGTPDYMAPEVARAEPVTPLSDLYSLGALAFTLLTGRNVFVGETANDVVRQHATAVPPAPSTLMPSVPAPLDALVLELLNKDPEKRPQSAEKVRERLGELRRLLEPTAISAAKPEQQIVAPVMRMPEPVPPKKSRGPLLTALAVLVLGVGGAAAVLLLPHGDEETDVDPAPVIEQVPEPEGEEVEAAPEPVVPGAQPAPVRRVKVPKPVPTERQLADRISSLGARLRKKGGSPDDVDLAMHMLSKQQLRLAGTVEVGERKEISKALDAWEQSYLH